MTVEKQCERCRTTIEYPESHTELVRRDFRDEEPQPSTIEYLCADCLEDYVTDFLGT